jgi:hypothetical protein
VPLSGKVPAPTFVEGNSTWETRGFAVPTKNGASQGATEKGDGHSAPGLKSGVSWPKKVDDSYHVSGARFACSLASARDNSKAPPERYLLRLLVAGHPQERVSPAGAVAE